MNPAPLPIAPSYHWGTPEGSRELDRLLDRRLTFLEMLEWQEEAEELSLLFQEQREKSAAAKAAGEAAISP